MTRGWWLGAALAALAAGCSSGDLAFPIAPPRTEPPFAASPAEVLRRLEWSTANLDTVGYRRLLTDDFRFVWAALDTSGNAWRTTPWGRPEELRAWGHMVSGGGPGWPRITSLALWLDRTFVEMPDPRPGHGDIRYRVAIRSQVAFEAIDENSARMNVSGEALFYLVRGDSAAIPAELRALLPRPDSTAWFLERWEDGTFAPGMAGTARALPSRSATLGWLRALYY